MLDFLIGFSCGVLIGTQIIALIVAWSMRQRGYLMHATMTYLAYFLLVSIINMILGTTWNPLGSLMRPATILLQATEIPASIYYFHKVVFARSMHSHTLAFYLLPFVVLAVLLIARPDLQLIPWIVAVADIQALLGLTHGFLRLRHYHVTLANYASTTPGTELRWVKLIMPLLLTLVVAWNVPVLVRGYVWGVTFNYVLATAIATLSYLVLRHTLSQVEILHNWDLVREEEFRESHAVANLKAMRQHTGSTPEADDSPSSDKQKQQGAADDNCVNCSMLEMCDHVRISDEEKQHTLAARKNKEKDTAALSDTTRKGLGEELQQLFTQDHLFLNPDLTLGDLADRLGTNITYVSQHINRELHTTFYELVNGYRMQHAEQLLRTTSLTLDQVATEAGFKSQTSFFRYFKKNHRMTPTEYRKHEKLKA